MPWQAPVGDIQCNYDQDEDDVVVCSVKLWYCGHDGSLWVNPSEVINVAPDLGTSIPLLKS